MDDPQYKELEKLAHELLSFICRKYGDVFAVEDWKCPIYRALAEQIGFSDYPEKS